MDYGESSTLFRCPCTSNAKYPRDSSALLRQRNEHTLAVGTGDKLFAYVYLDPITPPREVMLQFNDGTWEHRAYWGSDYIPYGSLGGPSKFYVGPLPPLGQWVRLEVSAANLGSKGEHSTAWRSRCMTAALPGIARERRRLRAREVRSISACIRTGYAWDLVALPILDERPCLPRAATGVRNGFAALDSRGHATGGTATLRATEWIKMKNAIALIILRIVRLYIRYFPIRAGKGGHFEPSLIRTFRGECIGPQRECAQVRVLKSSCRTKSRAASISSASGSPRFRLHCKHLVAGDCFIDVGANVGYFSLLAASIVGNAGSVCAIEASPSIFATLRTKCHQERLLALELFHKAVSDAPGQLSIFLGPAANRGSTTTISSVAARKGQALEAVVPADTLSAIIGDATYLAPV